MNQTPKVKRTRKRKNQYFTQETEDAILKYNATEDPLQRSIIYERHIHYPFFKLTQNIIHTFKFYHTEVEDLTHLQHEIIIFLLGKMELFHPVKSANDRIHRIITKDFSEEYKGDFTEYMPEGAVVCTTQDIQEFIDTISDTVSEECLNKLHTLTPAKAYSYFGTITKRWLIHYTRTNYKKKISSSDIAEVNDDLLPQYNLKDSSSHKSELDQYLDEYIEYVDENLENLFPKDQDARIADAVLEIFRKREDLDVFNKKALYIYIREQVDSPTPQITKVIKRLKRIFDTQYVFFLENGYANFTF